MDMLVLQQKRVSELATGREHKTAVKKFYDCLLHARLAKNWVFYTFSRQTCAKHNKLNTIPPFFSTILETTLCRHANCSSVIKVDDRICHPFSFGSTGREG